MTKKAKLFLSLSAACAYLFTSCVSDKILPQKPSADPAEASAIFKKGEGGYAAFRIPALFVSGDGTIFAFAEGRKNSSKDYGEIDSVCKISSDSGKTWSEMKLLAGNGKDSFTNPMAVQDAKTGDISFFCSYSPGDVNEWQMIRQESKEGRQILKRRSLDGGKTWGSFENITASVKHEGASWMVVGPSGGIQIEGGKYDGRLLVPVTAAGLAKSEPYPYFVWVIYSDDGGKTWRRGQKIPSKLNVNESQVAQIDDEIIAVNSRVQQGKDHFKYPNRHIAASRDGGQSWFVSALEDELPETVCEGAFKSVKSADGRERILIFSNPSPDVKSEKSIRWKRENLKMRFSDSKTYSKWLESGAPQNSSERRWKTSILVDAGKSAYSDIAIFPDGNIGILYERGEKNPYEEIFLKVLKFSDAK